MNKEIKITFKTLTPLWTGDAWGVNKEIRPSSIMGSLRFWFEMICYLAGVTNNAYYKDGKLEDKLDGEKFKDKIINNGSEFDGIDKTLAESGISLPSRIFGCTGWKGWIRVKKVHFNKNNFITSPSGRIIESKNWFWGRPSYQGNFQVIFEMENDIIDAIFYPILTFMEKYGFWGGKWNIGYGRLKVEKGEEKYGAEWKERSDWEKESFTLGDEKLNLNEIVKENNSLNINSRPFDFIKYFLDADNFFCNSERDFENKISNIPRELKIAKLDFNANEFTLIIEKLLSKKAKIRNCLSPNSSVRNRRRWDDFRHEFLGATSGGTQGTKIIPWVYEENDQLKGGFVSIAGILNLGD